MQSVDRAVELLRAVAAARGREATVAVLSRACGLNRATAWRILRTLESHDMVVHDQQTGEWSVGGAVVDLARSAGTDAMLARAHGVLVRLSALTGETADLAVLRSGGLTYVDEVRPGAVLSAEWLGRAVPLHATSTGKALLAFTDPAELAALLPGPLTAHTATTITDRSVLDTELDRTRERGYATCHGELEAHLHGVSAPVLGPHGRPLAVISLWGPDVRVTPDRLTALGALAIEAAATVAGWRDDPPGGHPTLLPPAGGVTQIGDDHAISPSTR